ncbi:MAG: MBL fold metallo-hydrolase [Erysipelotrichales bacterium]|nr:MBL fold metallo-hydrolase [Erysipelotrichales bacterium]
MELIFTGRGAAFNPKEGNTNAYFIESDRLFLVDCGETMFGYLMLEGVLNKIKEIYAIISHTHSDHCGSLGSIGLYCQFVLKSKLKIVVPHNHEYERDICTLMRIFGNTEDAYEIMYEEELDNKFEAFDSVRYDLTKHDFNMTCYSFIFETKNGAIFYSADTRVVDNLVNFTETHKTIDRIYMEVTNVKIPGDVHLYVDDLLTVIDDTIKDKIYLMHIRNNECMEKVIDEGFKVVNLVSIKK